MQGPHNRAVPCPICSEKFFPASLPFHQKQCEKRQSKRVVPCPYCGVEVTQINLKAHVGKCPKGAGAKKRGSSQDPRQGGGASTSGCGTGGGGGCDSGPGQYDPEVTDDGRMRCIYCGRYFTPDRIDKHQTICGKLKNARPKGVNGEPTQSGSKVFNAEAQRLGKGATFISPEVAKRKDAEKQRKLEHEKLRGRSTEPAWRRQHEEFVASCRAGRGGPAMPAAARTHTGVPNGMVTCPHCSRNFGQQAADRHIPICAKVLNRPKPPPSPAPGSRGASPAPNHRGRGDERHHGSDYSDAGSPPTRSRTARPAASPRPAPRASSRGAEASPKRNPSGSGLHAARGLRQSTEKLPPTTGGSATLRVTDGASDRRHNATAEPASPSDTGSSYFDNTLLPSEGSRQEGKQGGMARLGLRRSAMLYRLLSQVPQEALQRELQDTGQSTGHLDQESMIEALLEQLE